MKDIEQIIKITNRLQMMYGSCKLISSTLAITYSDEVFKFFKVSDKGAKLLGSSVYLKYYDTVGIIALWDKIGRQMSLYTTAGDVYTTPKCYSISKLSNNVIALELDPGKMIVVAEDGVPVVKEPLEMAIGFNNGIIEMLSGSSHMLYSDISKKLIQLNKYKDKEKCSTIIASTLVYTYRKSERQSDGTLGVVYDTKLNMYDKIVDYIPEKHTSRHLVGDGTDEYAVHDSLSATFQLANKKGQALRLAMEFRGYQAEMTSLETWNSIHSLVN